MYFPVFPIFLRLSVHRRMSYVNGRLTDDAVGRADGVPHAADERDPQKVLHGLPSHLEPLRL